MHETCQLQIKIIVVFHGRTIKGLAAAPGVEVKKNNVFDFTKKKQIALAKFRKKKQVS
jgi:hypothetical protein